MEVSAVEISTTNSFGALPQEAERVRGRAIAECMKDANRFGEFVVEANDVVVDMSRQQMDSKSLAQMYELCKEMKVMQRIEEMFAGKKVNVTEKRSVYHMALRAARDDPSYKIDGTSVMPEIYSVLDKIKAFSTNLRSKKNITDILSIGIGGSYLGVEFVYEALRTDETIKENKLKLHFLANVDPIDIARAVEGLNPETTLVLVISKTFTTAETMLNARSIRSWMLKKIPAEALGEHFVGVTNNVKAAEEFGINAENCFKIWDWVGGRFSVCSAVGVLPLSLALGYNAVEAFLAGAREMDDHFRKEKDMTKNLPLRMALQTAWNQMYLKYDCIAVLPYCQALLRFPAHIQQLCMESNGKNVQVDGKKLASPYFTGGIYFGEPGTNGQHSFYQLLHQGKVVPAEFIGFKKSQRPWNGENEPVSNHDELMSNFFAQPDALAVGLSREQLDPSIPEELKSHKVFPGNRPSTVIMMDVCNARSVGQLLALYEHRVAVEGFLLNVDSFDQWGVELGKVLAKNTREIIRLGRSGTNSSELEASISDVTKQMIQKYLH